MDRETVIAKIDDWEARLQSLVDTFQVWYERLPQDARVEFLRGAILQIDEGMLREYSVPPRMLPHCAVLYGRKRLSLVPGPLWVLGSNGSANLTTNKRQFKIVDMGNAGSADWHIVTSQVLGTYRPLTEEVFRELVLRQELDAA